MSRFEKEYQEYYDSYEPGDWKPMDYSDWLVEKLEKCSNRNIEILMLLQQAYGYLSDYGRVPHTEKLMDEIAVVLKFKENTDE